MLFPKKSSLKDHMAGKHETPKYECKECKMSFKWRSSLFKHNIKCHGSEKEDVSCVDKDLNLSTAVVSFQCPTCGKSFSTGSNLRSHQKSCGNSNSEPASFQCNVCGMLFPKKSSLKDHIAGKHELPKYECKNCKMNFQWRSSLFKHKNKCPMHS